MKFQVVSDKNRKLNINWDRVNMYIAKYQENTPFDVEIVRRQPRVSDPMRRYYFSTVLRLFAENQGYERHEELGFHDQLKALYFGCKPDKWGVYRDLPSVFSNESPLPVSDKKKFMDWVVRLAAKEGVYIPDPNEGGK